MPTQFEVKSTLVRIWNFPVQMQFMDPLPPMHRRGILLGAALIIIGLLLPSPVERQASHTRDMLNRFAPTPSVEIATTPQAPVPFQDNDIEQQWRAYRVKQGQTLAQVFRDNHLPPADVYAMTDVQGNDKPLSHLQHGQIIRVRQNASGVVTGLTIENNGNDNNVLFSRQPNGRFVRVN